METGSPPLFQQGIKRPFSWQFRRGGVRLNSRALKASLITDLPRGL